MVTILILIDGFLQCSINNRHIETTISHNPYFNRWFSAIKNKDDKRVVVFIVTILILIDGFLQYAIRGIIALLSGDVTILILIDGFLQ